MYFRNNKHGECMANELYIGIAQYSHKAIIRNVDAVWDR